MLELSKKSLLKQRFLLFELVKLNLFVQYKQSKFSLFWILFNPFFQIAIWTVLHYAGFLQTGAIRTPYPVYLVSGMVLWWYGFNVYESVSNVYIKNTGMILENKIDVFILVIECVVRQTIFFIIHLLLLLLLCLYYKLPFHASSVLYVLLLLPLLFFNMALGMIFAIWRVLAVDIAFIFDKILFLLFFITPVLYKPSFKGNVWSMLFKLNPYSYLITMPRNALLYDAIPKWYIVVLLSVGALLLFILAKMYFRAWQYKTTEKLLQ